MNMHVVFNIILVAINLAVYAITSSSFAGVMAVVCLASAGFCYDKTE